MSRGEPKGWGKSRFPTWLIKIIRELGDELLYSCQHHGGNLPLRFLDKDNVPDHHVVTVCLLEWLSKKVRSTTGKRRKRYEGLWRQIAQKARLGPFSEDG